MIKLEKLSTTHMFNTKLVLSFSKIIPSILVLVLSAFSNVSGSQLASAQDPQITKHPTGKTVQLGETVSFTVEASGAEALLYQWRFEGARIIGATTPELVLENITESDVGTYTVEVTNDFGSA